MQINVKNEVIDINMHCIMQNLKKGTGLCNVWVASGKQTPFIVKTFITNS